jgi:hypothetical protein
LARSDFELGQFSGYFARPRHTVCLGGKGGGFRADGRREFRCRRLDSRQLRDDALDARETLLGIR